MRTAGCMNFIHLTGRPIMLSNKRKTCRNRNSQGQVNVASLLFVTQQTQSINLAQNAEITSLGAGIRNELSDLADGHCIARVDGTVLSKQRKTIKVWESDESQVTHQRASSARKKYCPCSQN